jgi:hypothetical protein
MLNNEYICDIVADWNERQWKQEGTDWITQKMKLYPTRWKVAKFLAYRLLSYFLRLLT